MTLADPVTDTQALLARRPGLAVLAFRGTEPHKLRDWRTDLRARPRAVPGLGRVHGGFWQALEGIWPQLRENLRPGEPLALTGHSLGGALAMLAAARLLRDGHPVRQVITFGAPRAGDSAFVRSLDAANAVRVVRAFDLVPHLPPAGPLLGYRHAGHLLYIDANGVHWRSPGAWVRLTAVLQTLLKHRGPVRAAINAHDRHGYVRDTGNPDGDSS